MLNNEFHPIEAVNLFNAVKNPIIQSTDGELLNSMTQEQLGEEGLSRRSSWRKTKIAFLSEEEKNEYWERLEKVKAEIEKAKYGQFCLIRTVREPRR